MLVGLPELKDELGDRFTVIQLPRSSPEALAVVRNWLHSCALLLKGG
jgi:hypothetical protein